MSAVEKPKQKPVTLAATINPKEKAIEVFFKTYDDFVTSLAKVFGNPNNLDDPLTKALGQVMSISTSVDRSERIVLLATRWNMMVTNERNIHAFETKNEAFFIANLEGLSIFSELGIAELMKDTERFPLSRDQFWSYVSTLSKRAAAVLKHVAAAAAVPVDPAEFERDAQMTQTLESLGLLVKQKQTGEIQMDIKKLMDKNTIIKMMRQLKNKGHNAAGMKAAMETVTEMLSESDGGEAALAKLLSSAH